MYSRFINKLVHVPQLCWKYQQNYHSIPTQHQQLRNFNVIFVTTSTVLLRLYCKPLKTDSGFNIEPNSTFITQKSEVDLITNHYFYRWCCTCILGGLASQEDQTIGARHSPTTERHHFRFLLA